MRPSSRSGVTAWRRLTASTLERPSPNPLPTKARPRTAAALLQPRFDPAGGWHLDPGADGVDGAMARLAAVVVDAMGDGTWSRLKPCRNHGCRWLFYDHSTNRSGTWCTMSVCGNRRKARAYRRRHQP
jgi:predicted RNA-binding Zn ribbon-like protein